MKSIFLSVISVLASSNCATPLNLLSSYPGKKSCDGGDQDFVEYMKGYPSRKYNCAPSQRRQYYDNNEARPITVTKNEIKTITVDYYANNNTNSVNNASSIGNTTGNCSTNSKGSNDVTVTRFIVSTQVLEKPFTLFREVTTTITVEKPIINYKVTTFTETTTKIETRTAGDTSVKEEVPKTVRPFESSVSVISDRKKYDDSPSGSDPKATPSNSIVTVYATPPSNSIVTVYATPPSSSIVTVYATPQAIQPSNSSITTVYATPQATPSTIITVTISKTVNQISKPATATSISNMKRNCLDAKCVTRAIGKGCEVTQGQQGSKPKTICRFTNVPVKKRNRRRTVVKTVYEKAGEEAKEEGEGEESTVKTVFV